MNNSLNQVMLDMTVKGMLNPDNKDFYIKDLTLAQLEQLANGDAEAATVLIKAFSIALSAFLNPSLDELNKLSLVQLRKKAFVSKFKLDFDIKAKVYTFLLPNCIYTRYYDLMKQDKRVGSFCTNISRKTVEEIAKLW